MIPKIIHLIWFGKSDYPPLIKRSIDSWKKYHPEYMIMYWNEDTFPLDMNKWVAKTYKHGYYAFLADYVRFYALYNYGGIYIETDTTVLKKIDDLLENEAFIGTTLFNSETHTVEKNNKFTLDIIGAKKGNTIIKELLDYYDNKDILADLENKTPRTINSIVYEIFKKHGYTENFTGTLDGFMIYPPGFFLSGIDRKIISKNIDKAYSIHLGGVGGGWGSLDKNKKIVKKIFTQNRLIQQRLIMRMKSKRLLKIFLFLHSIIEEQGLRVYHNIRDYK